MRALSVEFLPVPSRKVALLKWGALLVFVLCAVQVFEATTLYAQANTVKSETAQLNDRVTALKTQLAAQSHASVYQPLVLRALVSRLFQLEEVLSALEAVSEPGVQVVSVDVNLQEGAAKAELEAQSTQELEKYLGKLSADGNADGWRVERIQESNVIPLPTGSPGSGPLPAGFLTPSRTSRAVQTSSGSVSATLVWK